MTGDSHTTETSSSQPELERGKLFLVLIACQQAVSRIFGWVDLLQLSDDEMEDAGISLRDQYTK